MLFKPYPNLKGNNYLFCTITISRLCSLDHTVIFSITSLLSFHHWKYQSNQFDNMRCMGWSALFMLHDKIVCLWSCINWKHLIIMYYLEEALTMHLIWCHLTVIVVTSYCIHKNFQVYGVSQKLEKLNLNIRGYNFLLGISMSVFFVAGAVKTSAVYCEFTGWRQAFCCHNLNFRQSQ